jgi:glucose-6-phosphate 1-epimerase
MAVLMEGHTLSSGLRLGGWWLGEGDTRAFISAFGGQLLSLRLRGREVLWCTPEPKALPAALRGGVPICWPWFGPAQEPGQPQHGLVRTQIWQAAEGNSESPPRTSLKIEPSAPVDGWAMDLTMSLDANQAACTMIMQTRRLQPVTPESSNSGATALLSQAFHTYFAISPDQSAQLQGLQGPFQDNLLPGRPRGAGPGSLSLVGAQGRATEQMFDGFEQAPRLQLHAGSHKIVVESPDARSVMVWNPGPQAGMADVPGEQWREFVCVEIGHLGQDARALAPGQSLTLTQRIHLPE